MTMRKVLRGTAKAVFDIGSALTSERAGAAALEVVSDLGFHSLSVVERPDGQAEAPHAILFSNVPEPQTSKYRVRGYAAVDPIVQRTLRGDSARLLSGIGEERLSNLERKIYSSYHCASGVRDGLVIPVRRSVHPDGIIAFGGVEPNLSAPVQAALTVLGHVVYGRLTELRSGPAPQAKLALSPRERQVLGWVAKGKADADIAIILGMSERTARFHMANAKIKLDAPTRVRAVTKAIELGLIDG